MPVRDITTLKGYFAIDKIPSEANYRDLIDSISLISLLKTANVMDFGAKGDGVTDDSAAIQAAIDSLLTTGGIVYFPPGIYLIGIGLATMASIYLQGSGENSSFIKASAAIDMVTIPPGAYYWYIEKLGFLGNSLATTGIKLNGDMAANHQCGWARISDVVIRDCIIGIDARRGYFIHYDRVYLMRNTSYGLKLTLGGQFNQFYGWLQNNGKDIYVDSTTNNNKFYGLWVNDVTGTNYNQCNIHVDGGVSNYFEGQLENFQDPALGYCVLLDNQAAANTIGIDFWIHSNNYDLIKIGTSANAAPSQGNRIQGCKFTEMVGHYHVNLEYAYMTVISQCMAGGGVVLINEPSAYKAYSTKYIPSAPDGDRIAISADITILSAYGDKWLDASAATGLRTLTLPHADLNPGLCIKAKKTDSSANRVLLTRGVTGFIYPGDGAVYYISLMLRGDWVILESDGVNWNIVGSRISKSVSITPTIVNAGTTSTQTFNTFYGLIAAVDFLRLLSCPALQDGLIISSVKCSADSTIEIKYANVTAGNITPATGVYTVQVFR